MQKATHRRNRKVEAASRTSSRHVILICNATLGQLDCGNLAGFREACCDSGAPRSVVGIRPAKEYCKAAGIRYRTRALRTSFLFGDTLQQSLGKIVVRLPTRDGAFFTFKAYVVEANVPLLLGLEVLDRERLVADNVENVLHNRRSGWKLPIVSKDQHMYVTWNYEQMLNTRAE